MVAMLKQKAKGELLRHIRNRFKRIKVEPAQGLFNFRCFENAVEYARLHPNMRVVEVMLDDSGEPILHYINQDMETGVYYETTQGWRAEYMDYYFLREIHKEQHGYIGTIFSKAAEDWSAQFTKGFIYRIFGINRVC